MNKKNISNKTEYFMHGELPKAEGLGLPGMTCGGPLALHPVGYAP